MTSGKVVSVDIIRLMEWFMMGPGGDENRKTNNDGFIPTKKHFSNRQAWHRKSGVPMK